MTNVKSLSAAIYTRVSGMAKGPVVLDGNKDDDDPAFAVRSNSWPSKVDATVIKVLEELAGTGKLSGGGTSGSGGLSKAYRRRRRPIDPQ